MIYGYCRISRREQNIERQIRNILAIEPTAKLYQEAFTGTKIEGRKELEKLLKILKSGDTIIFDSVSRMSRSTEEGAELYFKLYNQGINLIFIKEKYINTEVYKRALGNKLEATGNKIADEYIEATNRVLKLLAKEQIRIAFEQSEKEVKDLRQRTSEGIETAKQNGKKIGLVSGTKLITKKSIEYKAKIEKLLSSHTDKEIMELTGLARNTYYKYKKQLIEKGEN